MLASGMHRPLNSILMSGHCNAFQATAKPTPGQKTRRKWPLTRHVVTSFSSNFCVIASQQQYIALLSRSPGTTCATEETFGLYHFIVGLHNIDRLIITFW
mmetsp:Transcript_86307/g.171349  ORF Transcript_86307/g.171349 Transcript_86307/m.171349 type:complete len:100 (+) Transcript_86307:261-560(+)